MGGNTLRQENTHVHVVDLHRLSSEKLPENPYAVLLVALCTTAAQETSQTPAVGKAISKTPVKSAPAATNATKSSPTSSGAKNATTNAPRQPGPTTSNPQPSTSGAKKPKIPPGGPGAPPIPKPLPKPGPVDTTRRITRTPGGDVVSRRKDGTPADIHVQSRGMDVHHNLNGNRHVVVERADHSRIVVERGGHGYIQRPYF